VITVAALRAKSDGSRPPAERPWLIEIDEAVSEDLNTPRALTVLDNMLADRMLSAAQRLELLQHFDDVLGLELSDLDRVDLRVRPAAATLAEADIETRLADRRNARAAKDFARSDAIRDELAAAGIEVMDGDPLGWDWRPTL
jgi:cysteinyl-tRNA synthetase